MKTPTLEAGSPSSTRTARDRYSTTLSVTIGLAIVAGIAMRIWILLSPMGMLDSDEANVGLMARHFLDGEFRFFLWGQEYGGTANVFVVAVFFLLFGSSRLALKLVPILECAAAAYLVWRIGRRTIGEPAARVAAALSWAWPAMFVWFSTHEQLFYYNTVVLGLIAVLCALRLVQGDGGRGDAAAIGVSLGLGWWSSPQIAYYAVPVVLWLIWSLRGRLLPFAAVAMPAAVFGALPWIWHNVKYPFISLALPASASADTSGYLGHLWQFFETGLPISLGLKVPFTGTWVPPVAGVAVYLALIVLFVFHARRPAAGLGLLFLIAGVYPLIFSISPLSAFVIAPRYLVFLAPIAALLIARLFCAGGRKLLLAAALAASIALTVPTLSFMNASGATILSVPDVKVPDDFSPLIRMLDENSIRHVFANYWISCRLTFETDERIIATPFRATRYLPYLEAVRRSPAAAYVFLEGSISVARFNDAITRIGMGRRQLQAGPFLIFVPDRTVTPQELGGIAGEL